MWSLIIGLMKNKVIGEFKHHENIVFAFVGDGTVKNQIEEYSIENQLSNVTFIPYQKKEDLIYSLNAADVHLVTNQKGIKGISVPSNVVINNWINEEEIYPLESEHERVQQFKEQYELQDKFVIMYSGNIGLYYDLENIIKVIGEFKHHENIVFAFVGDGTVKNQIEEYSIENQLSNVTFIPYQKKESNNSKNNMDYKISSSLCIQET